ncbi:Hypothetical predicted protein [Octopus vulgaris]|uniref:Uncharacterized protein n=1 Tax=Octopus vulgaris TaxID=6645 RepID=A0AA36AT70_OCTVU|nr:Hypothetical predicted protein [Octopus vulgaris]
MSYLHILSTDYYTLWDAEDKYKWQKKKLATFMKDWQKSTKAYLTFSANEQTIRTPPSSSNLTNQKINPQVKAINRCKYFDDDENDYFHRDRLLRSAPSNSYHLPRHVSMSHRSGTPRTRFLLTEIDHDADNSEREVFQRIPSNRRQTIPQVASPIDIYERPKLPRNIKHQFGSSVCNELLNNENMVNETMSKIERKEFREKKGGNYYLQGQLNHCDPSAIQTQLRYRDLSNYLRRNIFSGEAIVYTRSTTQCDYSEDNYNVQFVPSKYRRKKYEDY